MISLHVGKVREVVLALGVNIKRQESMACFFERQRGYNVFAELNYRYVIIEWILMLFA